MMTQEDLMQLYDENDWGVYKYSPTYKDVVTELIKFSDEHPDDVMLSYWHDRDHHNKDNVLFDLENIVIDLFYWQRNGKLYIEIDDNDTLRGQWNDSDSYTLSDERIAYLKEDTKTTKQLLKDILALDNKFSNMTYNTNHE